MANATIQITQGATVGTAGQSVIGLDNTTTVTLTDSAGAGASSYLWEWVAFPSPYGSAPTITNSTLQVATVAAPGGTFTDGVYILRLTRVDGTGTTNMVRFFAVGDEDGIALPSSGMNRSISNVGGSALAQAAGWFGSLVGGTNIFLDAFLRLRRKREGRFTGKSRNVSFSSSSPVSDPIVYGTSRSTQVLTMTGTGEYTYELSTVGAEDGATFRVHVHHSTGAGNVVFKNGIGGSTITTLVAPGSGTSEVGFRFYYNGTAWLMWPSFTNEDAQDAVGGILTNSARVSLAYSAGTPSITGDLITSSVSNTYLADMTASTIKGRSSGTGAPQDLTSTEATAILDVATTSLKGLMSAADKTTFDAATDAATANTLVKRNVDADASFRRLVAQRLTGTTSLDVVGTGDVPLRVSTGKNNAVSGTGSMSLFSESGGDPFASEYIKLSNYSAEAYISTSQSLHCLAATSINNTATAGSITHTAGNAINLIAPNNYVRLQGLDVHTYSSGRRFAHRNSAVATEAFTQQWSLPVARTTTSPGVPSGFAINLDAGFGADGFYELTVKAVLTSANTEIAFWVFRFALHKVSTDYYFVGGYPPVAEFWSTAGCSGFQCDVTDASGTSLDITVEQDTTTSHTWSWTLSRSGAT